MNRSGSWLKSAWRFGAGVLALGCVFAMGLVSGYWIWGASVNQARPLEPVTTAKQAEVSEPVRLLQADTEPVYRQLLRAAEARVASGDFSGAIDLIVDADLAAKSPGAIRQVSNQLDATVDAYVLSLNAEAQSLQIDELFEQLTLTMPERGVYFLKLAEHRVMTGNAERALGVLAQIENHRQFGERARQMIDEITIQQVPPADLAVLPLTRSGDQFLIQAVLGDSRALTLLIDTGASITVISPTILSADGYRFNRGTASFATANGVVDAPLVRVARLAVGDVVLENFMVGALTVNAAGNGIDGLLGMNFLREFEFALDQDAAVLRLQSRRSR